MSANVTRIYTRQPLFLQTFHGFWEGQMHNPKLRLWQRVFAVAMARSGPNLHTPLEPGELATMLGKRQQDGSLKPVARQKIWEAIEHLTAIGWLDPTSDSRCLVLPAEGFRCGRQGNGKLCPYHSGQSSKVQSDIAVRDYASPIDGESYRAAEKAQARAILRPEIGDMSSPKTGHDHQPAGQGHSASPKTGHLRLAVSV